jgi:hypothetical protein
MQCWNMPGRHTESGRASLEFLVFGIAGVIPLMFLGMSVSSIQGATLAVESAARNAATVFVHEHTLLEARARAETAAVVALANHGFDSYRDLEITCTPVGCVNPGDSVTIRVWVDAPLFSSNFLPGLVGAETVPIFGESTRIVSRYGVPR